MSAFSEAIAKMNEEGVLQYSLETGQRLSKFDKLFNDRGGEGVQSIAEQVGQ